MFNFGPPPYLHVDVEGKERTSPKPEDGDAEHPDWGTLDGGGGVVSVGSGVDDAQRMQTPIGTVPDTKFMRQRQMTALTMFATIHVAIVTVIVSLSLIMPLIPRLVFVFIAGGLWLIALIFNLRMASSPRRVIQTFLQSKHKSQLGKEPAQGQVVVIRGVVSLLHEELLSTEFHNVPGLVVVESSLRSFSQGHRRAEAWTEHVRQTRAVDFLLSDPNTGQSALVKAFGAAEAGVATPLVHMATEIPLSTATPMATTPRGSSMAGGENVAPAAQPSPRIVDADRQWGRGGSGAVQSGPQLMVCKGYIRQGQTVTVMGCLVEDQATRELSIQALQVPKNVSQFLLMRGFFPYFFPTWVTGLVISDQKDVA